MSKFGREGTHTCLVGKAPTAQRIQVELAEDRMRFLLAEIQRLETSNGDLTNGAPETVEGAAAKSEDFKRKVKMISDYIDSVRSIHVGQEDGERGCRRPWEEELAIKDSNGSNLDGNDTITSDDKRSSAGTELLRGLLRDTTQYVMPEEFGATDNAQPLSAFGQDGMDPQLRHFDEYEVQKSNVLVLIKPQIVLRSLVDDKSTMILTATRTRMQNYSVTDTEVEEDSINERVLFRNYFALDGLQAFQPSKHCSFLQRHTAPAAFCTSHWKR
ncbi:hypothetical protein L7F22_020002 [Adiantum nelumboides]|nr:hypothetical protein [Adiantum nelumboides]